MIFSANQHSKISDIDGKLIYSDNEMEITNFVMLLKLCKKEGIWFDLHAECGRHSDAK